MGPLRDRWSRNESHGQRARARVCSTYAVDRIRRNHDTVPSQRLNRHRPQAEILLQLFDGAERVEEILGVSLRHLQLLSFVHLLPDKMLTCRMLIAGSQGAQI